MSTTERLADQARDRLVTLHGHFVEPVRIETVEPITEEMLLVRVRTAAGSPAETVLTVDDLEVALKEAPPSAQCVDPLDLFRWVEGQRIRLAYAHDPYFAVSLCGVRGLPHQIEAVYRHLLPQPRLRFVLADDPGAGKTIMGGLLLKELKLRGVVDRTLVVAPAPLTVQWQDELLEKFDEHFVVVSSIQVKGQLGGNPWQRHSQVVTSLDFAKREEVLPDLLRAEWDFVVIDEAHKCAAVTESDGVRRTRRYVLAEELSRRAERLLLLTATPHSGDEDRFTHFLRLLDSDQFATSELVKRQIGLPDNPYFLRRQKEHLVDERGRKLFVPRTVRTQPFTLSDDERALYDEVTEYVNRFLGATGGGRGFAVALARTVLQRRLASSLGAIRSSLRRRAERLHERANELERLGSAERRKRLVELRVLAETDDETGTDDADEGTQDAAAVSVSAAAHLDQLREEVYELRRLTSLADTTMRSGEERKLGALRSCLQSAELTEVRDGRGKLLIFTEHRDTLMYLVDHLRGWGYSVCAIHGGHPATARKAIQHEFQTERQICVATEAAGEGINLQFCHLMINYDLPWNPVRLEQRMGRIHRIGQQSEVVVFNFCATNTIEGRLLQRLHEKLDEMRAALHGRVYDVIGDLLALNGLDFEWLLKDTLANPRREQASLDEISSLSPELLETYEQDVGIAQATRHVNLDWVRERNHLSEERRLVPEYVERYFLDAAERMGMRVERRADDLHRVPHVPRLLRSDELRAVRRLGHPADSYRKLTFRKEDRERAAHQDAVLCSPGHPLFAALGEALDRALAAAGVPGGVAAFVDPSAREPYRIHFLTFEVVGESAAGEPSSAHAEVAAVLEDAGGQLAPAPPDVLHDLTPGGGTRALPPPGPDIVRPVTNWVRATGQSVATIRERERRRDQAELRARYLEEAFDAQRSTLESRWAEYEERVFKGEEDYRLLRDETARRVDELERRRAAKLDGFAKLGVVRAGPVTYLGCAVVAPPDAPEDPAVRALRQDPEVERAAMRHVMAHEVAHGRDPEDISQRRDGTGFDIRSIGRDPETGELEVRRIEVKGRSAPSGDVGLYRTEWFAARRFRAGYWLYVVYGAGAGTERLVTVQDPFGRLRHVHEVTQVTGYRVPSASIEAAAKTT